MYTFICDIEESLTNQDIDKNLPLISKSINISLVKSCHYSLLLKKKVTASLIVAYFMMNNLHITRDKKRLGEIERRLGKE